MNLSELLQAHIWKNAIPLRVLAKEIGISKSTLSRICNGYSPDCKTTLLLINWLFRENS